jgi:hypothetical protein
MVCTTGQTAAISSVASYNTWRSGIELNLVSSSDAASVSNAETQIASMLQCLTSTPNTATSIQEEQSALMALENEYYEKAEDVKIAKERVERMRNPNQYVSFYESWFPTDKPINKSSIPILLAMSILFFTLFLGFMLATVDITFAFNFEATQIPWLVAATALFFKYQWLLLLVAISIIIWLATRKS